MNIIIIIGFLKSIVNVVDERKLCQSRTRSKFDALWDGGQKLNNIDKKGGEIIVVIILL